MSPELIIEFGRFFHKGCLPHCLVGSSDGKHTNLKLLLQLDILLLVNHLSLNCDLFLSSFDSLLVMSSSKPPGVGLC